MDINGAIFTLIALQFSRTYLPAELCSSHSRRPPWKYLVLVRLTILKKNIWTFCRKNIWVSDTVCSEQWMAEEQVVQKLVYKWPFPKTNSDYKKQSFGENGIILEHVICDDLRLWDRSQNLLHHCQVFSVIMSLEECEPKVQLEGNAANAPDVTRLAPAELQDDLRSSVVSGTDHLTVMLPVKCGATKVNQADLSVLHLPDILPLQQVRW